MLTITELLNASVKMFAETCGKFQKELDQAQGKNLRLAIIF